MQDEAQDNAGVIGLPPLLFAVPLAAGVGLGRWLPAAFLPRAIARPLGAVLVVVGLLLDLWFIVTFRRADTAVNPTRPTTTIALDGPYQYTRNPAYLGFSLVYAGVTCLTNSLWSLLLLPPTLLFVQRGVIEREERYLERKFGDEYRRYKARVRRWL